VLVASAGELGVAGLLSWGDPEIARALGRSPGVTAGVIFLVGALGGALMGWREHLLARDPDAIPAARARDRRDPPR
jgi:hypothetical protein